MRTRFKPQLRRVLKLQLLRTERELVELFFGDDVSEVGACVLLIMTSLFFTMSILEALRTRAAPRLADVGEERVRAHMATVFF